MYRGVCRIRPWYLCLEGNEGNDVGCRRATGWKIVRGNGASDVVKSAKKRQKAPRRERTSSSYKSQLGIGLRSREPSQSVRAPDSARGRTTESIQRGLRLGARVGSHALARFESGSTFPAFSSPSKARGPRRYPRPAPSQFEFALNYADCHSRAASPQVLLR
jgi:hypothetical protein